MAMANFSIAVNISLALGVGARHRVLPVSCLGGQSENRSNLMYLLFAGQVQYRPELPLGDRSACERIPQFFNLSKSLRVKPEEPKHLGYPGVG